MALRSQRGNDEPDFEVVLDDLEKRLERLKRLYEQYFMGIQKIPPSQLHAEVERGIRAITQKQPRRTALRYRLNTITQRFGTLSTYWNRVMRQIEQGTYVRDMARVKRRAYDEGEEIPDEVLAKMPAMMRKRVLRDREKIARRHEASGGDGAVGGQATGAAGAASSGPNVHHIDESDPLLGADLDTDMEELFSSIMAEDAPVGNYASGSAPGASRPVPESGGGKPEVTDGSPELGRAGAAWREPGASSAPEQGGPGSDRDERSRAAGPGADEGEDAAWREPGKSAEPPAAPTRAQGARGRRARSAESGRARDRLPPGLDEDRARDLYQKYVRARKMVGASGDVTFDQLMGKLRSQAPRIMKQHQAEGVDFNVVLKDNRVVVKATPKK